MSFRKRRPPTLKKILSKELPCSRRRIHVSDKYMNPVTDQAVREFIAQRTDYMVPSNPQDENPDCDDYALAFHKDAKDWFRKKKINAMVGEIWTYATKKEEAHAFTYSVKPNYKVTFWESKTGRMRFLNARVELAII